MHLKNRIAAVLVVLSLVSVAPVDAQSNPMRADIEQFAMDLHVGIERSSLTPEQKAQLRDDFRELREAHQNHRPFEGLRAARSIRKALDSGAFQPQDAQRIKQDIQTIKEAREDRPGGFGE